MSVLGWQISIIDGLFSQTIGHIQRTASGDQACVGEPVQTAAGDLLPTEAACCGGVGRFASAALVGECGGLGAVYPHYRDYSGLLTG